MANFSEKRVQLVELLEENLKNNSAKDEILALAQEVMKKGTGGAKGPKKDSKVGIFKQMLLDAVDGMVSEDDVWKTLKWGKHEAQSAAWGFRKKAADPEDILWIQFETDEESNGNYVLKGSGPDCPEGFVVRERKAKVETPVETEDTDEDTDTESDY